MTLTKRAPRQSWFDHLAQRGILTSSDPNKRIVCQKVCTDERSAHPFVCWRTKGHADAHLGMPAQVYSERQLAALLTDRIELGEVVPAVLVDE